MQGEEGDGIWLTLMTHLDEGVMSCLGQGGVCCLSAHVRHILQECVGKQPPLSNYLACLAAVPQIK